MSKENDGEEEISAARGDEADGSIDFETSLTEVERIVARLGERRTRTHRVA